MKRIILFLLLCSVAIQANNFRDGMSAYKKGDFLKAKLYFEIALEKDKAFTASYMLGKIHLNGNGVDQNFDKAIEYFKFAQSYGNITAGCYASNTYMKKGIYNWDVLESGLTRGIKRKIKYCLKVVDTWMNK